MSTIDPKNYRAIGLAAVAVAEHRGAILVGTGVADPMFRGVLPPVPCTHEFSEHQGRVSADDAEYICERMTQGQIMFVAGRNSIGLVDSPEGLDHAVLGYDPLECKPVWSVDFLSAQVTVHPQRLPWIPSPSTMALIAVTSMSKAMIFRLTESMSSLS